MPIPFDTENELASQSQLPPVDLAGVSIAPALALTPPEVTPAEPHANPETLQVEPRNGFIRFARLLGVDRAIGFTVLARAWASLAGIGTMTLIAYSLSPVEQGFYGTFYSLVNLQFIFELGFSTVILQTASHEAAHLQIASDGTVTGPEREHGRLASVLQKAIRWYAVAAVLMAVTLMPLGVHFFRHVAAKPGAGGVRFVLPWLLVVCASSLTFQIDPLFSFLEGCGYVPQVARTRLRQSILSSMLGWAALLLHRGLFAPAFFIIGQFLAGLWLVYSKRQLLLPLFRHAAEAFRIDWGSEIWPFQWRIAVSWIAGYFATQLFVPSLMNYRGPVEAGQMSLSLTVCVTLTTLAVSWINTKASPFGRMIALKEYRELDRIFFRALLQSVAMAILAFAFVWFGFLQLGAHHVQFHGVPLSARLLPPIPLSFLFIGNVGNVIIIGEAIYLRAHKQEKFMINSIVGALYCAPVAILISRIPTHHGGAWGISAAYIIGNTAGTVYATYIFLKWRRIWHT